MYTNSSKIKTIKTNKKEGKSDSFGKASRKGNKPVHLAKRWELA